MDTNVTHPVVSETDLMAIGMNHIAYVRPTEAEGREVFAVHAADGTQVAVFATRDVALAAVRQNDMEPLSIH